MHPKRSLAVVAVVLIGLGAACSNHTSAATAAETEAATTETTSTVESTEAVTNTGANLVTPDGGPGSGISAESVSTVEELNTLIQDAYGDAGLGLHRGHQPVESTLIDVLGISHDEMHVRMEQQGQNLEAVAIDLGIDPQTLIDALADSWSPAIDTLLDDGTITQDQADAYSDALVDAFTYRVTWNGTDATPTFTGV